MEEKREKTAQDIYMRILYIEFERNRSIFLGSTFADGHIDRQTQTDTHTHTHTHTQKHTHTDTHTYTDIFYKTHR